MRDIPGLAWIIGVFALSAIALFIYTRMGPGVLPAAHSIWTDVERIRADLETRTLKIPQRESSALSPFPFNVQVERLSDQRLKSGMVAKYVLRFKGPARVGSDATWVSGGVDVGLVDFNPDAMVGIVRISALQRTVANANP